MAYERVGKEALYFSKGEIELLRSCVGKEIVATYSVGGEDLFGIAHLALEFADGSFVTVANEYADMAYLPGEGDNQYLEECGNFRLLPGKLQAVESYWSRYQLTHDDLPVCPIVRKAYVINQSVAYSNVELAEKPHSLTHTSGIILVFWDEDESKQRCKTRYMVIQQTSISMEYIEFSISDGIEKHVCMNMDEWNEPDLYSTSLIRVG